jgi:WXG100 family type VII secretion target
MAEVIRSQYEVLATIATRFGQWSENYMTTDMNVRQQVESLIYGGWSGRAAEAFFDQMGADVLPALGRLTSAFEHSQHELQAIIHSFRQAEQEAAATFDAGVCQAPAATIAGEPQLHAVAAQQAAAKLGKAPITDDLMKYIEPWEGRRVGVYKDQKGNRTIGVGFNLERGDARAKIEAVGANFDDVLAGRQTLTNAQIDTLFRADVENSRNHARRLVNNFDTLPTEAQTMVTDMIFNMGSKNFAGFRRTIQALEANDFAQAADEMQDSKWYREGGRRPKDHVPAMRNLATK